MSSSFTVEYQILEEADAGSVELKFQPISGVDTNGDRIVILSERSVGTHTVNFGPFSTLESVTGVASVTGSTGTGKDDMAHGAICLVYFSTKVGGIPQMATDAFPSVVFFDTETTVPLLASPANNLPISLAFSLDMRFPEAPAATTVSLAFVSTNAAKDAVTSRVVRFEPSAETKGQHIVAMQALSTAASTVAAVKSVTPASDLVPGATYNLVLSYQDASLNPAGTVTNVNIEFDTSTLPIVVSSPLSDTKIGESFEFSFVLPETAKAGSVKIVFEPSGGTADPAGTRTIIFSTDDAGNSVETAAAHTVTMAKLSAASAKYAVSPAADLVHDAEYAVLIEYQDLADNPANLYAISVRFDIETTTPVFTLPAASTTSMVNFTTTFTLPEAAKAGTTMLRFAPTGGTADGVALRTVVFAPTMDTAGAHSTVVPRLTQAKFFPDILSVTPETNLVNKAVYSITLAYQDEAGNTEATVVHANVLFDTATELATIAAPTAGSSVSTAFSIQFALPEAATEGTLRIDIVTDAAYYGVGAPGTESNYTRIVDFVGMRTVRLVTSFNANGGTVALGAFSTASDAANVVSAEPKFDMVDGVVYNFQVTYGDVVGNELATALVSNVMFAGTATLPIVLEAPSAAAIAVATTMPLNFTLPERALADTVKLTFTRVGGANDAAPARVIVFAASLHVEGAHHLVIRDLATAHDSSQVKSITPTTALVHGAQYDMRLEYQDGAGNAVSHATRPALTFAAGTTLAPTFAAPTADAFVGSTFAVDFTLPEVAKPGTCTLTFKPRRDLTPLMVDDAFGDRVVTFEGTFEQYGQHTTTMVLLTQADKLDGVGTVAPLRDLVDGVAYDVVLEYEDGVGNTKASVTHLKIFYAGPNTLPPAWYEPQSLTAIRDTFDITFGLFEHAKRGTLKVIFVVTGGQPDGDLERVLVMAASVETPGNHTVTLGSFSSSKAASAQVDSVTPQTSMVDGTKYSISIEYQDSVGNPKAVVLGAIEVTFAGTVTIPPVLLLPGHRDHVAEVFTTSFVILEMATKESIKIEFDGDASGDMVGKHEVTYNMFRANTYSLQLQALSTAAAAETLVTAVVPLGTDMVDGKRYMVILKYQDGVGNPEVRQTATSMMFYHGRFTMTPVLTVPGNGLPFMEDFIFTFTLPEEAEENSIQLQFTASDELKLLNFVDPNRTRIITFGIGLTARGTHQVNMKSLLVAVAEVEDVVGVVPEIPLVGGVFYDVELSYKDIVGNPRVNVTNIGCLFDTFTIVPTLVFPLQGSYIADNFLVSMFIPELGKAGTLSLTFTRTGGLSTDPAAPRVISFNSTFDQKGSHNATLALLSHAAGDSSPDVIAVAPNVDLVDGVVYSVKLEYQDFPGNAAASATHTDVAYAGNETKPPTLTLPGANTNVPEAFTVKYRLDEGALSGSVKMRIKWVGKVADPAAERVITFAATAEVPRVEHVVVMKALATAASLEIDGIETGVAAVKSVAPATSLVDGAMYDVTMEYQDGAGNPVGSSTQANVTFDTTTLPPILTKPQARSYIKADFDVTFTLPEDAEAGSVKLLIEPLAQGEVQDKLGRRTLVFGTRFEKTGTYTVTLAHMDAIVLNATNGIASVAPTLNLIHSAGYVLTFLYKDSIGNDEARVPVSVVVDLATIPPSLVSPISNYPFKEAFILSYVIPEIAEPGSVTLTFDTAYGDASFTQRVVFLSDLNPATHPPTTVGSIQQIPEAALTPYSTAYFGATTFAMTALATANTTSTRVTAVVPAASLVHDARYNLTLSYRDAAGNVAASDSKVFAWFDTFTAPPVLAFPGNFSALSTNFLVNVTMPEIASAGSLKLTFTYTGGVADSAAPRVILFNSSMETKGFHFTQLAKLSTTVASNPDIKSIAPPTDLVDGAVYRITMEYIDLALNDAGATTFTDVGFHGDATLAATLANPSPTTFAIPTSFAVDFTLPERALAGSVQLIFNRTGGANDSTPLHTITFSSAFENAGTHQVTMKNLTQSVAQLEEVAAVEPATRDLVHATVYTVILQYQDAVGNAPVQQRVTEVTFAGAATLAPTFFSPVSQTSIPDSFLMDFLLPEVALPGSVHLSIIRSYGLNDTSTDPMNQERIVVFGAGFETAGRHTVTFSLLSTATELATPSPAALVAVTENE